MNPPSSTPSPAGGRLHLYGLILAAVVLLGVAFLVFTPLAPTSPEKEPGPTVTASTAVVNPAPEPMPPPSASNAVTVTEPQNLRPFEAVPPPPPRKELGEPPRLVSPSSPQQ